MMYGVEADGSRTSRRSRAVALAAAGFALAGCAPDSGPGSGTAIDAADLAWVATARQNGIVGYRDPAGAISPNGALLAYAEGRDLRVVPVGGGAPRPMARADGQVRHLAWLDDGWLLASDRSADVRWWRYDASSGEREPLWDRATVSSGDVEVELDRLGSLSVSPDGSEVAGIVSTADGWQLWRVGIDGSGASMTPVGLDRVLWPTYAPDGSVGCIVHEGAGDHPEGKHLRLPCEGPEVMLEGDIDVVGPLAFGSTDGRVYFASPDGTGMVDLMAADVSSGAVERLAGFARDTYAPTLTSDDRNILFRSQSYRTFVAEVDVNTGAHWQLTLFQAETPSYDPAGERVAFTFGTWRRQVDDVNYPDIQQHIGIVPAGASSSGSAEPVEVVAQTVSEDQAMDWSPNGRWIALHSHREESDDVWLRPADGSSPDRQITFLGRGAEVGWPRWSADGRTVLVSGASAATGLEVLYTVGVDQESGEVTREMAEIPISGLEGVPTHAEWMPDSRTVIAIAKEGPGRHALFTVPMEGGTARVFHRFESEHDFPGIGIRRDGGEVAFIAPGTDGYFQLFRMPVGGGPVTQVTFDPINKSQPNWSPDGRTISYTAWDYRSQFWMLQNR